MSWNVLSTLLLLIRHNVDDDFINITSFTMWTLGTPTDDFDSDVYVCRAFGSSSSLTIRWRAFDPAAGGNTLLSNGDEGVEVSGSVEGEEEVSVLRLSRGTMLQSISCRVNIGNTLTASEANSEFLGMLLLKPLRGCLA